MSNFKADRQYDRYRVIQTFNGHDWIDGDKEYPSSDRDTLEKDFMELARLNQEMYRVVNRKRKREL